MRTLLLLLAALSGLISGCLGGPIYDPNAPTPLAGSISPRTMWRAYGDLSEPAKSIDGDVATFALSAETYANASITIDLGKPCVFNMVTVDHGPNQFGFCKQMAVLTSIDGKTFTMRESAVGCRRVSTVLLITPTLARYIRIQALQ